jgi:hypothetical protein
VKIIPDNISVPEQFLKREQIDQAIYRWLNHYHNIPEEAGACNMDEHGLKKLEEECGIKCGFLKGNRFEFGPLKNTLIGYEIVNEPKYVWFLMKWMK